MCSDDQLRGGLPEWVEQDDSVHLNLSILSYLELSFLFFENRGFCRLLNYDKILLINIFSLFIVKSVSLNILIFEK